MNPYYGLANGIILQAVRDYRSTNDAWVLHEVETFFRSAWFGVLTEVDSDLLIDRLRAEKLEKRLKKSKKGGVL